MSGVSVRCRVVKVCSRCYSALGSTVFSSSSCGLWRDIWRGDSHSVSVYRVLGASVGAHFVFEVLKHAAGGFSCRHGVVLAV